MKPSDSSPVLWDAVSDVGDSSSSELSTGGNGTNDAAADSQDASQGSRLRSGCYLLHIADSEPNRSGLWGTLRVFRPPQGGLIVTADVYSPTIGSGSNQFQPPDPSRGIPAFPRRAYSRFFRLKERTPSSTGAEEWICTWFKWDQDQNGWTGDPIDTEMEIAAAEAPDSFPDPRSYFDGFILRNGRRHRRIRFGWVSPFFRQAVIDIDAIQGCGLPLDNGAGVDWQAVGRSIGWNLVVRQGSSTLQGAQVWTGAELHSFME